MEPAEAPSSSDSNGSRDQAGRFTPGNKCGKGNPYAKRIAEYREAFHKAVTDEDMVAVAQAVLKNAKLGDVPSARFIADYTLGKPTPVEISDDAAVANVPGALVINLIPPDRG